MNIFFDLDGTLLNSQKRLYELFQYLVPTSELSFEEYWKLKRNKVNHEELLTTQFGYSPEEFKKFEHIWMKEIELEKWLNLDLPFEGVTDFLKTLGEKNTLYLVTARQSKEMVNKQLRNFGWDSIFESVFVTEQRKEKHALIQENVTVSPIDWFIGDTGLDIKVGKQLGIKTAAVLSGFLNKEKLTAYKPDLILEYVTSFTLK